MQKNISLTGHIVDALLTVVSRPACGQADAPPNKKIFTDVMQEAAEKASRDIIASAKSELVEEFKKKGNNVIIVDKQRLPRSAC